MLYCVIKPSLARLMPLPPHHADDRPGATQQLFSGMKAGQEIAASSLPLGDR